MFLILNKMNCLPNMTKINFPTNMTMNNFIIEYKINELLNTIMNNILYNTKIKKIDNVHNFHNNIPSVINNVTNNVINNLTVDFNYIKIKNSNFQHYSPEIITEVKIILCEKGYIITDIEDEAGINIGWKLLW